jgi:thiamine pyrophosphate-dependent acetolactate synthase large subunit-like protein
MAAAIGRLDRTPGVVLVPRAPRDERRDRRRFRPISTRSLLVFSSHKPAPDDAKTARQHIPAVRFYQPITKMSAELTAANVHELLPRAVQATMSGYLGPAYLPSLEPEQLKDVPVDEAELERIIDRGLDPERTTLDAAAVEIRRRHDRERPTARCCGRARVEAAGASRSSSPWSRRLARRSGVTPQAVGQVPADHPLFVGLIGWHDARSTRCTSRQTSS